jgi:hypothetical protein
MPRWEYLYVLFFVPGKFRLGKYVGFFTTIAALAFKKEYTVYCSYKKLLIFSTLMVCDDSYA